MYAIIIDGGRQYKVEEGLELDLDYREASAGDEIVFDEVVAWSADGDIRIGTPNVLGAKVTGEVVSVTQGPKLVVQKFRRRKTTRRKNGHRQMHTRVKISKLSLLSAT
ncbi:MAG: 50S ribosomal protein L21 [Planctomycetia bacterium]|nr:50S ribosomal protein L21 [Planctomycetia bacterium]